MQIHSDTSKLWQGIGRPADKRASHALPLPFSGAAQGGGMDRDMAKVLGMIAEDRAQLGNLVDEPLTVLDVEFAKYCASIMRLRRGEKLTPREQQILSEMLLKT